MFKKIQKHLLVNHPLLWNTHIVPALACTVLINVFFFCLGYFTTQLDFKTTGYYSMSGEGYIYFGSVVSAILSFIFWMMYYSKNNAFKVFYPKTTGKLYLEWILVFIIVLSMVAYPFSVMKGVNSKIQTYSSKSDMIETVEVLNMVHILIPQSKNDYYKQYPESKNYAEEAGTPISELIEKAEKTDTVFEGFPDFAPLSLLNYSRNSIYIPSEYDIDARGVNTVKQWLLDENKEEIGKLMDSFLRIQERHQLKTNLTKEKWLELVYNPRKYPVGDFNLIARYDYKNNDINYVYTTERFNPSASSGYYLQYAELSAAYNKIMTSYMNQESNEVALLWLMFFGLSISLLVFSFRVTSGKGWLIAIVALGIILLLDSFISMILHLVFSGDILGPVLYIVILLAILLGGFIYVISKLANKRFKGWSHIVLNILVWSVPAIPTLIFILVFILSRHFCGDGEMCWVHFMKKHISDFVGANIALTFLTMWLFIRFVVMKWKSLPED